MMTRLYILMFVLGCGVYLSAQGNFDQVEIKETKLTDHIYMLEGAGGNMGLFIGESEAILVDDQYAPLSEKILLKLQDLTDKPLRKVINTHWHGDHTGGNANMSDAGATIIAHENVYQRMSAEQVRGDRVTPASPPEALPTITYDQMINLRSLGEPIMITHVHHAHTDGDSFVYFANSNVLHMGDVFFHKRFPFIDASSGGSLSGVIRAVEAALMITDGDTQIIPGHGPMATKDDLRDYLFFLQEIEERMTTAISEGATKESINPKEIVEGYESMSWSFINEERFVQLLYTMLAES